jgi:hypothetical protein
MPRLALLCLLLAACGSRANDPPKGGEPTPLGNGVRVKDVRDHTRADHPKTGSIVNITGAVVTFVDQHDETKDGKARGTIYVQDVASNAPFSAITLFSPTFVPADLRVAPGDVIDLYGEYVELPNIGTANFGGKLLPQLSRPVATFRYEYQTPEPAVIDDVAIFDDYEQGRKWLGMLVTIKNVTLAGPMEDPRGQGRFAAKLTGAERDGVTLTTELADLSPTDFPQGAQFKSITGIVTWFFNYHIAPRSPADVVR